MLQRSDLLQDSPSKRIGHKAAAGDLYLDVDLEMDELRNDRNHTNTNHNPNPNPAVSHRLPPLKPYDDRSKSHRVNPPPPREPNPNPNPNFNCIFSDEEEKFGNEIHEPPAACSCSSSDDDHHHHDDNHTTMNRRRSMKSTASNVTSSSSEGQVLKCTSIQRKYSGLGRLKTRSRLLDPPETHKSGQLRPEPLGRSQVIVSRQEEDEEDPLFDEDLPDEYKNKSKFDIFIFLEWISLILIITALVCTNTIAKWKIKKFRGLHLWKWEVLVLILICGRLVSGMGIRIVVFFIERNFLMRKRVLYFVYGVKRSVNNCIWLGMVWIAWHSMFAKALQGNDEFLWYVNKSLLCMIVGTLLWLVKTLMVKILASSFHVSTFFDRIQESLFTQYVIETLLGQPHVEIQRLQEEEERTMAEFRRLHNAGAPPKKGASFRFCHNESGINIDNLNKMNAKNVSAWRMKRLMKVVKKGLLTTLDERVQHSSEGDEASTQIRSEFEAKCAARKIFRNVAQPKSKFIYLEDLMRFLQEQEALKTMSAVEDSTESGRISKASLKTWVVNAFIERRALALTLNDTKTAVNKLHQMVNVLVGLIIVIVCLVFLEIATSKFLLYISSQIFVVVFIFGNTCKTIFEAIIFVFVMHPFDVGDRCEIDGVQMIVEEMNILTTVFLRFDNLKIIYPNVTLATRYIGNFYRSPDMGDSVDFLVHITTPPEKIALIKQKFANFIDSKPEHWYPQPSVVLMNIEQLHMMKLSVWMRHKMNFQNMGDRWKRRALLVEEMVKILKENDIEHRLYPLDVNIRSMPQISSSRVPHGWSIPPLAS